MEDNLLVQEVKDIVMRCDVKRSVDKQFCLSSRGVYRRTDDGREELESGGPVIRQ